MSPAYKYCVFDRQFDLSSVPALKQWRARSESSAVVDMDSGTHADCTAHTYFPHCPFSGPVSRRGNGCHICPFLDLGVRLFCGVVISNARTILCTMSTIVSKGHLRRQSGGKKIWSVRVSISPFSRPFPLQCFHGHFLATSMSPSGTLHV